MIALRSLAFQILFYANLIGQLLFFSPVFFLLPERTCWRIVKNWARSSLWLLHRVAGTRSEIVGQEHLPAGATIIASKHQSFWETFALVPELDRPTFILKKELMAIPVFGAYCRRMGMIPVDRSRRGAVLASMLEDVEKAMAEGRQIIIFPEGTRSYGRGLLPFKMGAFHIALEAKVPLVPVCMSSTHQQFKLNRWNNGKVIIQMLAPVELSKEQNIRQFAKDLRNQMAAQISALDAELGNDYTSQQQPQSE